MSQDNQKVGFGLWYDFRNPRQWQRQSSGRAIVSYCDDAELSKSFSRMRRSR
jgi:hypothetical protein